MSVDYTSHVVNEILYEEREEESVKRDVDESVEYREIMSAVTYTAEKRV